jgi:hypothetical protein
VSLFVLSPEIEDRDEVEVGNWAKHKKTFYSYMIYTILSSSGSQKKSDMNSFIFICCSYNFQIVIPSFLVEIHTYYKYLKFNNISKALEVDFLTLNDHLAMLILTSVIPAPKKEFSGYTHGYLFLLRNTFFL